MNNKGQVARVMAVIVVILFTGVFLNQVSPIIDDFRVERLNEVDNHDNPNNPFMKFLWYSFMPLLWGFYVMLSILGLYLTTVAAGGKL